MQVWRVAATTAAAAAAAVVVVVVVVVVVEKVVLLCTRRIVFGGVSVATSQRYQKCLKSACGQFSGIMGWLRTVWCGAAARRSNRFPPEQRRLPLMQKDSALPSIGAIRKISQYSQKLLFLICFQFGRVFLVLSEFTNLLALYIGPILSAAFLTISSGHCGAMKRCR